MKTILLFLTLTIPIIINAQVKHELKYDVLSLCSSSSFGYQRIYYEMIPKQQIGWEAELTYQWDDLGVRTKPINGLYYEYNYFNQQSIGTSLTFKLYTSKKRQGAGLFMGAYNSYLFLTKLEKGYKQAYLQARGRSPETPFLQNISVGGALGFKLLLLKRIPIEPSIRIGIDLLNSYRHDYIEYDGSLFLKVGYRFGKNNDIK